MKNVRYAASHYPFVWVVTVVSLVAQVILNVITRAVWMKIKLQTHRAEVVEGRECPQCGGALKIKGRTLW